MPGRRRRAAARRPALIVSLPLIASSPMLSRPDRRLVLAFDRADQGAAHHGELQQVLGAAVDVGAEVEDGGVAVALVRHHGRDRRPVDAVDGLQHVARDRHQRAGVAGRDAGLRERRPVGVRLDLARRRRAATNPSCGAAPSRPSRSSRRPRLAATRCSAASPAGFASASARPTSTSSAADARRGRRGTPAASPTGRGRRPCRSTARRIAGRNRPPWTGARSRMALLGGRCHASGTGVRRPPLVFSTLRPR